MPDTWTMKTPLATHIGSVARKARQRAGLTQEEVAERMELATEVYGRLERGKLLPSLPTLLRLCRALALDANALLGMDTSRPPAWLAPPAPRTSESPVLRRLLRTAGRLTPRQLEALGRAARAMLPATRRRTAHATKKAIR